MGDEQRSKVLKVVLASGSLLIIGVGGALVFAGQWFGVLVAAFGVLDLISVPFIVRMIGGRRGGTGAAPLPPGGADVAADPPPEESDPSHNPYARED